jgi:pSer/pThr/pTyr-binding forkhead associated (FHA) protein
MYLENPTISRKHAVIQHKDTGDIFVYDLGSTHGTYLNKKLIGKNEYIKL